MLVLADFNTTEQLGAALGLAQMPATAGRGQIDAGGDAGAGTRADYRVPGRIMHEMVTGETALTAAQTDLAAIDRQLADPATYAAPDRAKVEQLNAERARLAAKVAELEEDWLELEMAKEEAG